MKGLILIYVIFSLGLSISCEGPIDQNIINIQVDSLFEISSVNRNKCFLSYLPLKDTLTPDGWLIKYLIDKDSAIFIQWSKDTKIGRRFAGEFSERSGFIASYIGEDEDNLFLWQRCATDCQTLLVADKNNPMHIDEYFGVVDFDLRNAQILNSIDDDTLGYCSFRLTDLNKKKSYNIRLKGFCEAVKVDYCLDTVIFGHSRVTLKAMLSEIPESDKLVTKSVTIDL